ncbi:hypothetical protein AIOL_004820 [Candidatus Rhodobacter oscarellae]|uniref:Uncharacterized protein n=1 Tax=Candidatus Rhodobacter oscarellae TaxID=1675527 RepID=A0A0J9EB27_9RHOB|nr:hypothetical protein AIOL_004820 [Candidatus Rhodobacter lobularis]
MPGWALVLRLVSSWVEIPQSGGGQNAHSCAEISVGDQFG